MQTFKSHWVGILTFQRASWTSLPNLTGSKLTGKRKSDIGTVI